MELSEVILALVGVLTMIIGGIVKFVIDDVKKINSVLTNLPKEYVLKNDYKEDIAEIKHMISEMYGIIRKNGIK